MTQRENGMARCRLEDFELGATLGVGTVGTIFCARDRRTGQEVAVKILHPTVSGDALIRARFWREMMILEKLSHPNIIRYLGGGRDGEQLFFAMERADGATLKDLIGRSGRLNWGEAATCGIQISSALQHAHNHGIIHRDLKPANLLLTSSGELKLVDFGIARDTTSPDLTSQGLTVGTYAYMSPEQIVGNRSITGQTDLYALGCLLFEMLTGRPPFEGDNFAQLFEQHLHQTPPRVRSLAPDCPSELDDLVAALLNKSPDDRPFNARTVQATLMRLLDQSSLHDETSGDVAAQSALDMGRLELSRRVGQVQVRPASEHVSWFSLACVLLVVVGAIWAAMCFGV
jgi:eukaryotic-like serine/threonine-protein kinase